MQLAVQDASRLVARASMRGQAVARQTGGYICRRCQHNASIWKREPRNESAKAWRPQHSARTFSWTVARRQEDARPKSNESASPPNGTIHATKHTQLPSRREEIRWRVSKYVNQAMDDLMPKLAVASQRINTFTGTDYSGIESLRKEIREQESLVKTRHQALLTAKESLETARTAESVSRKEVVSLLERRHGWSDTDLERYMSLIRSEHLNDQAVSGAKEALSAAEQSLDEARNKLEKMERMQYHEEQIWSDTIRRNSTWVTFGLMGVNILLLLVTMGVVEPWRRKRMVREIKAALEEKMTAPMLTAVAAAVPSETPSAEEFKKEIDQVIEPVNLPVEVSKESPADEPYAAERQPEVVAAKPSPTSIPPQTFEEKISDLFSERIISVRQKDISTIALEGAAAGALVAAIIMALLRPH